MDLIDLRNQFGAIKTAIGTFEGKRPEGAYSDLVSLASLLHELQDDVKDIDLFDSQIDADMANNARRRYAQLAAMLKAIHLFANIFYDVLLAEITGNSTITLQRFLTNPNPSLRKLSTERILPAYCVAAYRHKVIAHHEVRRMNAYKLPGRPDGIRLVPFPEKLHIQKRNVELIEQLKEKYKEGIEQLRTETNQFNLLKILFYGVPIGELGKVNPDRKTIDKIVESGGCESMTANEIITATDDLVAAVAEAV